MARLTLVLALVTVRRGDGDAGAAPEGRYALHDGWRSRRPTRT